MEVTRQVGPSNQGDATSPPAEAHVYSTRHFTNSNRGKKPKDNLSVADTLKVYVTGFPRNTKISDIKNAFSSYGKVKVPFYGPIFAVVAFDDPEKTKDAILQSLKHNILGMPLKIRPFLSNQNVDAKRNSEASKIKGEGIEPSELNLTGDFKSQLVTLVSTVIISENKLNNLSNLYKDLENVLGTYWQGCKAIAFGSTATGLGIISSDADCFIELPEHYKSENNVYVNRAKKILMEYPNIFTHIKAIPHAHIPIVKLFHIPTNTNCDLSFKTPLGCNNSKLVAFLLKTDERLIPVMIMIKYWAHTHELSGSGRLTNYALTMLFIFYLQQAPSVLPSVEFLQRDSANEVIVDGWNAGFLKDENAYKSYNNNTLNSYDMIGGFFDFYANFNFKEDVVCPFLGYTIKKKLFMHVDELPDEMYRYKNNVTENNVLPFKYQTPICIQDPFQLCHNVASVIGYRKAEEIKAFFVFAAEAYNDQKSVDGVDFLKSVLLKKPPVQRKKKSLNNNYHMIKFFDGVFEKIEIPDWISVVQDFALVFFEQVCNIKLTKTVVNDTVTGDAATSSKDTQSYKYKGTITNAFWKQKQFNEIYKSSDDNDVKKQICITKEIMKTDEQFNNIDMNVRMCYEKDLKTATFHFRLLSGDIEAFKEFGKFVGDILMEWLLEMLKPHFRK
ncbi:speckle targeted PIP5K1A-regulated poly(A) polymerase-like [Leptidea sinapis]|uniref:RRM domain-containing protein n=1 Tax=Leptidea sinapis TaxID=189913 RepID=A0A5E4PSE0_9NEOP|nr:speckle targeted PIP5K1A-regulated poly(A) polymerase-like [Leptidea sinapis]XP_050683040.1 speckle targeted PIP5K1A-regulated poly(A) polymerase-like [Leptidea sinapis]VVC87787.1 unnamed protein product [Leptidea sinapis]